MNLDFFDPYAALAEIKKKQAQGESMRLDDFTKKENGEPFSKVETITPNSARSMLETSKSFVNRNINSPRVTMYAKSIIEGRWQLNGQAIVVDKQGRVIDGQHRLLACIKAGIPFASVVSYNVDAASFITIDKGRSRTISDNLTSMGVSASKIAAGAAKLYLLYLHHMSLDLGQGNHQFVNKVTNEDIIEIATQNVSLMESAKVAQNRNKNSVPITPSRLALCMTVALERDADKARTFFDFFYNKHADPMHPAVQAREKLRDMALAALQQFGATKGLTAKVQCGIIFHALNLSFYQKERKTRIVFNVAKIREDMPRLM